jgi:hypothetical protein
VHTGEGKTSASARRMNREWKMKSLGKHNRWNIVRYECKENTVKLRGRTYAVRNVWDRGGQRM